MCFIFIRHTSRKMKGDDKNRTFKSEHLNECIRLLEPEIWSLKSDCVYSLYPVKWTTKRTAKIDDYAKDGGPAEVWLLCSFYHEPLRTCIKTNVNKFAISTHAALKLGIQAVGSYLKPNCEYELDIVSNAKVGAAKDHGENYRKDSPPLVLHL